MQSHTAQLINADGKQYYQTVVSERREGADHELLKIGTIVLPEVKLIKAYAEAAGMIALNQPESLQVLASRISGVPIPSSS